VGVYEVKHDTTIFSLVVFFRVKQRSLTMPFRALPDPGHYTPPHSSLPTFYISQTSVTVTNTSDDQCTKRQGLFWVTVHHTWSWFFRSVAAERSVWQSETTHRVQKQNSVEEAAISHSFWKNTWSPLLGHTS
jgi:hypothetical protein